MRQPLVAGNWKMHGTRKSVNELIAGIRAGVDEVGKTELAVIPPYIFIDQVAKLLADTNIALGAQNVNPELKGAFTGEISVQMLKDFGCEYVIIGHSERRALYGETDDIVVAKFKAVCDAGMKPILCVGETLAQREQGLTLKIVHEQLACVLKLKDNLPTLNDCVIAYEPLWAIGTGKTATSEQAQEVHAAIRAQLSDCSEALASSMRILYGGSVKPSNAAELMAMPDIDGALVGGASLDATQFIEIGKQCNH